MATNIWLDNTLVENAKVIGQTQARSASKQIEHWARIGRMMENNPQLFDSLVQQLFTSDTKNKPNKPETEPC